MADEIDISREDLSKEEQIALLRSDVERWNAWREAHQEILPILTKVNLTRARLSAANLRETILVHAHLSGATLREADLGGADLRLAKLDTADLVDAYLYGANLYQAYLREAHLERADLRFARLDEADLEGANLEGARLDKARLDEAHLHKANLCNANLSRADLVWADLSDANLRGADLTGADLSKAHLAGADLTGADLSRAILVETSLVDATLDSCTVYGISAWNVVVDGANQTNLRITDKYEPTITVDDLQIAQFLYLMLDNQKIRYVIDTLTSKVVLILGRFSEGHKPVLEAMRDALRQRGYVPVLFDSSGPESRNLSETVTLLARMARFIVADLTDPSSIPLELQAFVPEVQVPVQPLLLAGAPTASMIQDLYKYPWMLGAYHYTTPRELFAALSEKVIEPAEAKIKEIRFKRASDITRSGLP